MIEERELKLTKKETNNHSSKKYRKNIARIILPHIDMTQIENFS
jgi:ribosomal protein L29